MSATDEMGGLEAFWRRALRMARTLLLAGALLAYALLPGGRALALGLLLGGLVSILRFKLRYRTLMRGPSARSLIGTRLLTYGMSAAALAAPLGPGDDTGEVGPCA